MIAKEGKMQKNSEKMQKCVILFCAKIEVSQSGNLKVVLPFDVDQKKTLISAT
jgi:hypothetical protein